MAEHKFHYHVRENDPEYMPEETPAAFFTKEEAHEFAAESAAVYRDEPDSLVDEYNDGPYDVEDLGEGNYDISDENGLYRVIRTTICRDVECIEYSEAHPDR